MLTPEQIAEKAAADKAAADEAARVAAEAAKTKGDPTDDSKDLENKWDADTKKYIEKLRTEAAKNRTDKKDLAGRLDKLESGLKTALGLESNEPPEKQIENLKSKTQAQEFRAAVLESAIENGIGKGDLDYFTFLIEKEAGALDEGEELSTDAFAEIVKKVKKASGAAEGGGTTSVVDKDKTKDPNFKADMTPEQFAAMSITDKSLMYTKQPEKYAELMAEAKKKRLFK